MKNLGKREQIWVKKKEKEIGKKEQSFLKKRNTFTQERNQQKMNKLLTERIEI